MVENIEAGDHRVALVGTAHISRESVEEVSAFIRNEKPAMVCVEIDRARYDALSGGDAWQKLDMIKVIREGRGFLLIANLVLSSFQRRLGSTLGVRPGDEMKIAIETANDCGIPFAFCDREVQITLRRAWACCGFFSRCKLLSLLFSSAFSTEKLSEEEIENLKESSELDGMLKELSAFLPEIKETLIDERDYFLAAKIWQNSTPSGVTAAVIGAGHLPGVKAHIEQFVRESEKQNIVHETAALESVPSGGLFSKLAGWIIPALIIAFVAAGITFADWSQVSAGLLRWVLWNGSLAALGALAALAHPLAIIASFIGAPIGTLSPFISVGVFSGLAQAYFARPRVQDAQTLVDDVATLKGIYRNKISRILLVFLLASIGGMIGNIISFASFAKIISTFGNWRM